jgi:hypothetical protein
MRRKLVTTAGLVAVILSTSNLIACEEEVAGDEQTATESVQAEIQAIRERVLQRCGLSSRLAENKLPWYFFYEFGVELLHAGRSDAALEALQMTASLKEKPARAARMYGMWYVNYLPYYQMSIAYAQLEQWDRAWDAIVMSEALFEFTPGDYEYEAFESLKETIERERKSAG